MHEDGILEESKLRIHHNPEYDKEEKEKWWSGNWMLNNGILNMNVHSGEYIIDVFASRKGVIHHGVEYEKSKLIWYHDILVIPNRTESIFRIMDQNIK